MHCTGSNAVLAFMLACPPPLQHVGCGWPGRESTQGQGMGPADAAGATGETVGWSRLSTIQKQQLPSAPRTRPPQTPASIAA